MTLTLTLTLTTTATMTLTLTLTTTTTTTTTPTPTTTATATIHLRPVESSLYLLFAQAHAFQQRHGYVAPGGDDVLVPALAWLGEGLQIG